MNYDLVLCGVGGQGVLTIAWILDHAAQEAGLQLKQSEVHGMAQRGGAVSAYVRLSDQPVSSDLIATGGARLILSVEPMEALRYTRLLAPDGAIVTDVTPMINLPNYPAPDKLFPVLFSVPHLIALDATRLAHKAGNAKVQNMVVLGAAAAFLPLPADVLERQIRALFAAKGERILKANINAFHKGQAVSRFAQGLSAAGVPVSRIAQVCARLHFKPHALAPEILQAWAGRLLADDAAAYAQALFEGEAIVQADEPPSACLNGDAIAAAALSREAHSDTTATTSP